MHIIKMKQFEESLNWWTAIGQVWINGGMVNELLIYITAENYLHNNLFKKGKVCNYLKVNNQEEITDGNSRKLGKLTGTPSVSLTELN